MAFLLPKLPLLFLHIVLVFMIIHSPATNSQPFYSVCSNDANYTTNSSTYGSNLNLLLSSLSAAATPTGFSNETEGRPPDQVNGLALCRGDVSSADCRSCLTTSVKDTFQRYCPHGKRATLWYDDCMLRYSNQSFFSLGDTSFKVYAWNAANVSEPARFNGLLGQLMDSLTTRAAYRSARMFATGEANFTSFLKIYGLVQCTRDLSEDVCYRCLRDFVGFIPACCNGKQGGRVLGMSCYLRYEIYPFYTITADDLSTTSPPPPSVAPAPDDLPFPSPNTTRANTTRGGESNNTTKIVLIIVIPLVAALVLLSTIGVYLRRRANKTVRRIPVVADDDEFRSSDSLLFDLSTLRAATNDFSDTNKLGEGGFGPVYKGSLQDGQEIAVKRLSKSSVQGLVQLRNEVVLVAKLQHKNLVRLVGYCLEEQEKLLVYEYLPNTSLDKILFDPIGGRQLQWGTRYKIIEGIGRGLLYLHEDSRLRIIHRDLKASNILLDGDMNPKISDFGLAKLFGVDESQGNTSRIAGTYGYMAPEYAMQGLFSTKSDVYSYGVLVLEIVTGRKNSGFQGSGRTIDLLSHVWKHWNEAKALEVKDQNLGDNVRAQEVLRCIHIGLLCVQEDPSERPSMALVVLMLSSYSVTLPAPSTPAFYILGSTTANESDVLARISEFDMPEGEHLNEDTRSLREISVNDVSVSEIEPR